MATDYLTFTCTAPAHKAGAITVQLVDFTEPQDDWVVVYDIVPGGGVDDKDLGLGADVTWTFSVLISSADYATQVAKLAAWRLLTHGRGTIEYAQSTYGPITPSVTGRFKGAEPTIINPLYAEATATFQKVIA